MNVLIINKYFLPYKGGVEFHINNLVNNLQSKFDVKVTVVCKKYKDLPKKELLNQVKIIRVNSLLEMFNIINDNYSLLHVHMPRNIFTIISLIIAKIKKIPIVLTPHCFYQSKGIKKILLPIFDKIVTKYLLNKMDKVICLTEIDKMDALKIGIKPEKTIIIPNSIDETSLSNINLIDFKKKYDINCEYFLHIGRFHEVKNIKWLILNTLEKLDKYKLVLIGQDDGELGNIKKCIIENKIQDRVIVLEDLNDIAVKSAYAQSKLFIMTSQKEGLPTVLLESLFFGCPVLSSDVGGIPVAFNNAPNTSIYKYNNKIDFSIKLANSISFINSKESMQKFVIDKFSWGKNCEKIYNLYIDQIAKKS